MTSNLNERVASAYREALARGESRADAYFAAIEVYLSAHPCLSETQAGIDVANILLADAPRDEVA